MYGYLLYEIKRRWLILENIIAERILVGDEWIYEVDMEALNSRHDVVMHRGEITLSRRQAGLRNWEILRNGDPIALIDYGAYPWASSCCDLVYDGRRVPLQNLRWGRSSGTRIPVLEALELRFNRRRFRVSNQIDPDVMAMLIHYVAHS